VALGEVATRDYLRSELRDLFDDIEHHEQKVRKKARKQGRLEALEQAATADDD